MSYWEEALGQTRTCWRESQQVLVLLGLAVSWLAWERLVVLPEELEAVSEVREV